MKGYAGLFLGATLIVIAIVLGAVVAAGLYQWESTSRAVAQGEGEETGYTPPESESPVPGTPVASTGTAGSAVGAGNPVAGQAVYVAQCNGCHPDGKAGVGPDVRSLPPEKVAIVVRQGRASMPAYKQDRLSDEQLVDMVAYMATLGSGAPAAGGQATPAPTAGSQAAPAASPAAASAPAGGDPAAGKTVFAAQCTACHPDGKAGMGPDLRRLPAAKVLEVTRQGRGNMPAYKSDRLTDQQLTDIAAYLATLP